MFTKKYIFAKNRKMTEIQEKHNEIFTFLMGKREQNPELRFLLRSINRGDKLKKGYWFYGTDEEIYISFWNAWFKDDNDMNRQMLSLAFVIKSDGNSFINLRGGDKGPDKDVKNKMLIAIAQVLGYERVKGEKGPLKGIEKDLWYKSLEGNDYISNLEKFIAKDKPLIDSIIERMDSENKLFPFITEERFNSTLTKIKSWQQPKTKTLNEFVQNAARMLELRIENIKRFSNGYVRLNKPVVCFYGKNGSGKTTLLRSIAIAIIGGENIDTSKDAIKSLPKMLDGNKTYAEKSSIELAYTIEEFTATEPSYNPIKLISKSANNSIDIQNQDKLDNGELNPRTFNLEGEERDTFKTLIIGFAQQTFKNNAKSKNIQKPNLEDLTPIIYEEAGNRFDEFVAWVGEKLSPEKVPSFEQRQENRALINSIFSIISQITSDNIRLSNDSLSATIVNHSNPNGLPLVLMSQGYQNVVGWVGFFMKRLWEFGQTELPDEDFMKMPAVCLIDEIDTYLHPEWQYRILSVLVENFVNVQFIVTSHSPYVLSSIPNDKILLYELIDENGEIVIRRETENLFGADINEVSREMGTTKRFKAIDEKVDVLFSQIYDNQLDTTDNVEKNAEKTLAELQQQINVNDSDLIRAETIIQTKKLLRQRKQA